MRSDRIEDVPYSSISNGCPEISEAATGSMKLQTPRMLSHNTRDKHNKAKGTISAGRQFLNLAAADHVLFDAIRALQTMGFPEHTGSLEAERSRIMGKLAKLQTAAYDEFG